MNSNFYWHFKLRQLKNQARHRASLIRDVSLTDGVLKAGAGRHDFSSLPKRRTTHERKIQQTSLFLPVIWFPKQWILRFPYLILCQGILLVNADLFTSHATDLVEEKYTRLNSLCSQLHHQRMNNNWHSCSSVYALETIKEQIWRDRSWMTSRDEDQE